MVFFLFFAMAQRREHATIQRAQMATQARRKVQSQVSRKYFASVSRYLAPQTRGGAILPCQDETERILADFSRGPGVSSLFAARASRKRKDPFVFGESYESN